MRENDCALEASYFLGFDGGGTKTECVLVGSDGRVLARATGGPSNPVRSGYTRAWFSLSESADMVMSRQKITSSDIRGVCAGIGGAGRSSVERKLSQFFERSFPNAEVEVTTDLEIALDAAFGTGEGIVLVAGTGSAALGRSALGREARAGGRGPWFSDEGSGFDIGRRALAAVLLADEGRGPTTALTDLIFVYLQARNWDAIVDQVSKESDLVFPRLFPLVAQVADAGDAVAREILSAAAYSLASLAASVAAKLGWQENVVSGSPAGSSPDFTADSRSGDGDAESKQIPIALVGGMCGRSKFFDSAIDAQLTKLVPRHNYVELAISPAEAAARIASRAKGNAASAL